MIVDDNGEMRRLIRSFVTPLAEQIFECGSGTEAIAAYAVHHPDWVLMDVEMNEMDGITATLKIRERFPSARILIVTQYDNSEMRAAACAAGALGYVLKDNLSELRRLLALPLNSTGGGL